MLILVEFPHIEFNFLTFHFVITFLVLSFCFLCFQKELFSIAVESSNQTFTWHLITPILIIYARILPCGNTESKFKLEILDNSSNINLLYLIGEPVRLVAWWRRPPFAYIQITPDAAMSHSLVFLISQQVAQFTVFLYV